MAVFNERLRMLMNMREQSIEQVAAGIGASWELVNSWVAPGSDRQPFNKWRKALAKHLVCDVEWLTYGLGEMPKPLLNKPGQPAGTTAFEMREMLREMVARGCSVPLDDVEVAISIRRRPPPSASDNFVG